MSFAATGGDAPVAVVVHGSLTVRMDLAAAFEAAGFAARVCGSAAEARAAWTAPVAVAIVDAHLPDADGAELVREIRANPATSGLPVVVLPAEAEVWDAQDVVARAIRLARNRDGTPARASVLVIEDSPTFLEAVRGELERGGYTVLSAATGEDGLRLAALHRPTALIVDGELPGIDGPSVIRRIRLDPALRSVPCLLLTGSDAHGAELRALDAGADAFVRKDGDLELVLVRLGAVLRGAGGAPDEVTLLHPKRILVVDDSEIYRQAIAGALRREGDDVVTADSGEAALEILATQAIDCVLLDVAMPGLGGMETCRRIKASLALRDVPIVMVTAASDRQTTLEGLAAGADDCIVKSSELELLRARLHAQIRRRELNDETRRRAEDQLRGEIDAAVARAALQEADAKASLANELERQNRELEAFAYSVSHDLRSPLRSIDAFSLALLEDEAQALSDTGRTYLRQVRASAQRMRQLIDDLMLLSRIGRAQIRRTSVCLSDIARGVMAELASAAPEREVAFVVAAGLTADADAGLVRVLLENLLGNAWKFTARRADARIELGATDDGDGRAFFVQDNGAGFDRSQAHGLFTPFTRLHSDQEFAGTGIGLATVHRIVDRHGGRAWAEGAVGVGATIFFTLPARSPTGP